MKLRLFIATVWLLIGISYFAINQSFILAVLNILIALLMFADIYLSRKQQTAATEDSNVDYVEDVDLVEDEE